MTKDDLALQELTLPGEHLGEVEIKRDDVLAVTPEELLEWVEDVKDGSTRSITLCGYHPLRMKMGLLAMYDVGMSWGYWTEEKFCKDTDRLQSYKKYAATYRDDGIYGNYDTYELAYEKLVAGKLLMYDNMYVWDLPKYAIERGHQMLVRRITMLNLPTIVGTDSLPPVGSPLHRVLVEQTTVVTF